MGNATVVLLDDDDRARLSSALSAFAQEKGLSMQAVAKAIGVNRTYLYSLLDANQIELSRLMKIQRMANFSLVSDADAFLYSRTLFSDISLRGKDYVWTELCDKVVIDAFYLRDFLLPAINYEVGAWKSIYGSASGQDSPSVLPPLFHEDYMSVLLGEYCASVIEALGGDFGDISDQFYCGNPIDIEMPVLMNLSIWLEVFDQALDQLFGCYSPSEGLDGVSIEGLDDEVWISVEEGSLDKRLVDGASYQKLLKAIEQLAGQVEESIGEDGPDERLDLDLEYLKLLKAHMDAKVCILRGSKKATDLQDAILEYCEKENRMLRRSFYFPLELEEVLRNPDQHTFPIGSAGKQ